MYIVDIYLSINVILPNFRGCVNELLMFNFKKKENALCFLNLFMML